MASKDSADVCVLPKKDVVCVATDTCDLNAPAASALAHTMEAADLITISEDPPRLDANQSSGSLDASRILQPNSSSLYRDPAQKHYYGNRPDISKSKITFDGKSCVREFITEVEEYMASKDVSESFILSSFSDFLRGIAKKWFRTHRLDYNSWYSLKVALLKQFDKYDFDYQLEFLLRTRKQKIGEPLSDFIIELQDMSYRLSDSLSESTLINIIKHNMLRSYAIHFIGRNINSIQQIVYLGKEIEGLASDSHSVKSEPRSITSDKSKRVHVVQVENKITCLKCKNIGHHFKDCKLPGKFCFKCHKQGVTTQTCDSCNKIISSSQSSATVPKN